LGGRLGIAVLQLSRAKVGQGVETSRHLLVGYCVDQARGLAATRENSWSEPDGGGDSLLLPARAAIARRLIEGWLSTLGG